MKIHYTTSAWHGGFQWFFSKALRSLGHEVFYFDDLGTTAQRYSRRIFTRLPGAQYLADDRIRGWVSRDWLRSIRSFKPDLIILENPPEILSEAVREAKKEGYKIFYWVDSPAAGARAKDILASISAADEIFTMDRSKEWMTCLLPPESFHFLPFAGDPDIFHPLPDSKKEYDVVYVGSFPPQTGDGVIRAEIISNISDKYKVAVLGNNIAYWYKLYPKLKKITLSTKALPADEINKIYNKSKIVLAPHSYSHVDSISGRVHETAMAGVFQIADWRHDLDELYPAGLIPRFKWAKEVNELIDNWISRPEEREKIAVQAREHALKHNTWRNRAEEMLKHFKD